MVKSTCFTEWTHYMRSRALFLYANILLYHRGPNALNRPNWSKIYHYMPSSIKYMYAKPWCLNPWLIFLSGFCLLAGWNLHVNNGAPCFIWTGHRMESPCRGREHCPLPCFLFHQLVFCVIIIYSPSPFPEWNLETKRKRSAEEKVL